MHAAGSVNFGSGKVSVTQSSFGTHRFAPARTCSNNTALPVSTPRPFWLCVRLAAIRWSTLKYTFTDLIIAMVSPSGSRREIASRESITELSFSTVKREIRGAEPAGCGAAAPSPQATTSRPTKKFNGYSGQIYIWPDLLFFDFAESHTVNEWRNPNSGGYVR